MSNASDSSDSRMSYDDLTNSCCWGSQQATPHERMNCKTDCTIVATECHSHVVSILQLCMMIVVYHGLYVYQKDTYSTYGMDEMLNTGLYSMIDMSDCMYNHCSMAYIPSALVPSKLNVRSVLNKYIVYTHTNTQEHIERTES